MAATTKTPDLRAVVPSGGRALVYGLGLSGRAAARLLLAHGASVLGVDDGSVEPEQLDGLDAQAGFDVRTSTELDGLPDDVALLVLSPGVPLTRPLVVEARERGLGVMAEIELASRLLEGDVLAITGSNGKSTTTALTGELLRAAGYEVEVCGNIGEPLSDKVEGAPDRVFVVEVSSFQLETTDRFRPRVAALLNLAPDHLDRHGSLASYLDAKLRIFANQGEGDVAVLNADDPSAASAVLPTGTRRRLFSRLGPVEDGCYVAKDAVVEVAPGADQREIFKASDLGLAGQHNLENAMAASLIASSWGADLEATRRTTLETFEPLAHRMQKVGSARGVEWYDDSKATNVAATLKSLEGFRPRSVHLILGGRTKGEDLGVLREPVARYARAVYLIGESVEAFAVALADVALIVRSGTLDRAVAEAARHARSGDVVLLAPACASFDQFQSFRHRGEVFQRLATKQWQSHERSEVSNG